MQRGHVISRQPKSMNGKNINFFKGFTLVELVMTMIVVGIISIPLSLMAAKHMDSVFQSEDYHMAVTLARLEMEKVNRLLYEKPFSSYTGDTLDLGSTGATSVKNFLNYQGYNYDITRTVSFMACSGPPCGENDAESYKRVMVDVKKAGSATVIYSVVTYVVEKVNYGS